MNRLDARIHPLLAEEVVQALHSKQVFTVLDFVKADTQQIIKVARLNFKEVLAVKNFLLKKYSATPVNGFDCYKTTLNNTAIIPTGFKGLDNLLNGGLFTGNIYEICGLPSSGKTHFVLNLMKNVICNTQQHVYLCDTKGDFSSKRMKNMLKEHTQTNQEKYLSRILVYRTFTKHDLINGLYDIKNNIESNTKLRLIIVDSLPSILFSSNDVAANNAFLNNFVNILRYIATEHHCAFLITNLIRNWNDSDGFKTQDTTETIACGRYWFGVPNTRLKIEKGQSKGMRKITVLNSDLLVNKINNNVEI